MAETLAINFLDPGFLFDFYSDSGSTATPFGHSNVRWCGLEKFSARNGEVQFSSFFATLIAHGTNNRRARVLTFGTVGECPTMYSNWSKTQHTLTHYADRWRQTRPFFKMGQFKRPSLTHGTTQSHQIFTFAK